MSDSNEMDYIDDNTEKTNENVYHSEKGIKSNPVLLILSIVFFLLGFIFICLQQLLDSRVIWRGSVSVTSYILGGLLIICILFFICYRRRVVLLIVSIIYLTVSFSTMAYAVGNTVVQANRFRVGEQKLVSMCKEVYLTKKITNETYDRSKYGYMADFLTYTNKYFSNVLKISEDMNKDLAAAGYNNVLRSENLVSMESINSSKKRLEETRKILDKYEHEYGSISDNLGSDLEKMDMPVSLKRNLIYGFTRAEDENRKRMSIFFKFRKSYINKLDEVLDFMLLRSESYVVESGKVIFNSQSDVDKYKAYLKELEELSKEELRLITEAQQLQKTKIDSINQFK